MPPQQRTRKGGTATKPHMRGKRHNKQKNPGRASEEITDYKDLSEQLRPLGLRVCDVPGDGNCLFRALADQLSVGGHAQVREEVCQFIESQQSHFEPFIEDDQVFSQYVRKMQKSGTWGGNIELQAASMLYHVNITIHQLNQPRWEIVNFPEGERTIHLSYHDGDHYASVCSFSKSAQVSIPTKAGEEAKEKKKSKKELRQENKLKKKQWATQKNSISHSISTDNAQNQSASSNNSNNAENVQIICRDDDNDQQGNNNSINEWEDSGLAHHYYYDYSTDLDHHHHDDEQSSIQWDKYDDGDNAHIIINNNNRRQSGRSSRGDNAQGASSSSSSSIAKNSGRRKIRSTQEQQLLQLRAKNNLTNKERKEKNALEKQIGKLLDREQEQQHHQEILHSVEISDLGALSI